MATVAMLGTLDTKGAEFQWMRSQLEGLGHRVHLIDAGVAGEPVGACETTRDEVARLAGTSIRELIQDDDRGKALAAMSAGAAQAVAELARNGSIDGFLSAGGSGGSSIAAAAMEVLPVGFPKLLVSTMASGDVSPYVGASDVTIMYSVVDIAGINRLSKAVLGNAVAAIAGMAERYAGREPEPDERPLVAASMFGVTTPAVEACRTIIEDAGYEVLVFHATGAGGRALEGLAAGGFLAGVLDLTTTELADELVGGVLTAGPDRLTAAGSHGIPQVVSLGALDMVNFGARDTVPPRFASRLLYEHNATVTLMRTTAEESAQLGEIVGRKLAAASGPTALVVPGRGVSALDTSGGLFEDPAADEALTSAAIAAVAGSAVEVVQVDAHINDPEFARAAAETLLRYLTVSEENKNAEN
ncbi:MULTISPECIES: Tm-1-like ATP-binding domain-containing protein [unclassified Amycolatopsis]|uniref:Tm-1-like ATP-binding domain-containing protein n=1 Tax=unclassified Amycolatopsis TaxID=2618356 RepID=UPI00106E24F3|nr:MULTISPECIES: Tm-1-like ATP-binding domain-containing protein [unclassified Amycolatopsis]